MRVLVVPTIRENSIKSFLASWDQPGVWDAIIVVEDNPEKTFDIKTDHHFCWKDIEDDLGDDAWIISRKDSGIKCYGLWKAYQIGAQYVFCLDDDCLPIDVESFQSKHIDNLERTPRWTQSVQGMRTRGLPYHNLGVMPNVVFSVGLWAGVPDFDSVHTLATGVPHDFVPPTLTRIIPKDQFFPFCGMNFAFKRLAAPLCYFPLMGLNSPYGRFDDIWFGVVAKKICDHLDYHISCGEPFVRHERASNVFNNLVKEAPGIHTNETFWETIDAAELTADTPVDCVREMGMHLSLNANAYLAQFGKALQVWANLF